MYNMGKNTRKVSKIKPRSFSNLLITQHFLPFMYYRMTVNSLINSHIFVSHNEITTNILILGRISTRLPLNCLQVFVTASILHLITRDFYCTKRIKSVSKTCLQPVLHGQKETLHQVEPHAAAVLQCWVKEPPGQHPTDHADRRYNQGNQRIPL